MLTDKCKEEFGSILFNAAVAHKLCWWGGLLKYFLWHLLKFNNKELEGLIKFPSSAESYDG